MKTLIEFYDRSVLKNMVAVLALKPDYLIFFYDKEQFTHFEVYSTYEACKKYVPNLRVELRCVNYHDYTMIEDKITECIAQNFGDMIGFDLTGGSELMTIAGYKAGFRAGVSVFFTDIYKNEVIDLSGKWPTQRCIPFEISDMITAGGGELVDYTDTRWLLRHLSDLQSMAKDIIASPKKWAQTCRYFQQNHLKIKGQPLIFEESLSDNAYDKAALPDRSLMYKCQSCRLIENLVYTKNRLSFNYTGTRQMDYMASYGVWLELFTYAAMLDLPAVHDVKTSIKIDWNRQDDIEIIGNEVDVTAMYGCRPVVISCKQSTNPVSADTLNELYVVARRIGGKYSIPILVTRSDIKQKHCGIYMKAREMKLNILDASDLMSPDFKLRLLRTIESN